MLLLIKSYIKLNLLIFAGDESETRVHLCHFIL